MTNKIQIATVPVFTALAKTTNLVGRAEAIPFIGSKESGELEAKQTWKSLTILKQFVLVLQILFMLFQSCYFAQPKDIPLFQSSYLRHLHNVGDLHRGLQFIRRIL